MKLVCEGLYGKITGWRRKGVGIGTTEEIKILMVEDEKYVVDQYRSLTEKQQGVSIVYDTGSEMNAFQYLLHHETDVMILDLELQDGDGVTLLSRIMEHKVEKPFTVVVTNTVSNVTLSYLRTHGADFVYQKMNASYSPMRVISVIRKIFPYKRFDKPCKEHPIVMEFNRQKEELVMRDNLERELEMMGIKRKVVGFNFLVEASMLDINNPGEELYITNDIYPEVAKMMDASAIGVERSIRCAIETAFTKAEISRLQRYYPFTYDDERGRPTNAQFIENMAKRIQVHE